jgi:DNA-binding XRE family transcriptional regulator
MNQIKILELTRDKVTVARRDWVRLMEEREATLDRLAVLNRRSNERARGKAAVRRNYLTSAETRRLLLGESPVRIWREKRALSQRALAKAAGVGASYIAEIETSRKPGSLESIRKLAAVLEVSMEDLVRA